MIKKIPLVMLFLLLVPNNSQALFLPTSKVTIKVMDEAGGLIENANVRVSFILPKTTEWGTTAKKEKGLSDKNGEFIAENESEGLIGLTVEKDGYYYSGTGFEFKSRSLMNQWEPWNPTIEIVLKKKRNPVPMYAQRTSTLELPILEKTIGFDLEKGDWVTPYGVGRVSDFVFMCNLNKVSSKNSKFSCDIFFSNEKDGIQKYYFDNNDHSSYKWPFKAPLNGYENKLKKWMSIQMPGKGYSSNINKGINYLFRVRTKTDKSGEIVDARYGKIAGDIIVTRDGEIQFTYYFNPSGTRNIEFDMKKNLFNWSRKQWEREVKWP